MISYSLLFLLLRRRRLRGQAPGDPMAQSYVLGEAQHRDEGDRLCLRAKGRHERARPHRVLGPQDHLLHLRSRLPQGVLLDLQVRIELAVSVMILYQADPDF